MPERAPTATDSATRLRSFLIHQPVLILLIVGIPAFLANYFAGNPGINGWDANYYFAYSAAVADGGTLELDGAYLELVRAGADPAKFDISKRTATGQVYNYFPIGHPLTHAPATLLGKYVSALTEGRASAFGITAQLYYCLSCILAAAIGLLLIHRVVSDLVDETASAVALYSLFGCSMLGYYWFLAPALSHTTSLLVMGLVLTVYRRLSEEPGSSPGWHLLLGALVGWGVIVRLQDVGLGFFLLLMLYAIAKAPIPGAAKLLRAAALIAGGFAVFFVQMLHWRWKDGAWIVTQYSDYATFNPADPHLLSVLFSPRHGLFLWHPMLLAGWMAWAGAAWSDRRRPWIHAALLAAFVSIWVIGGCFSIWWFGDSFGSRPFLSVLPLFWIGLAWLWRKASERRGTACLYTAILIALAAWNALLAVAYHFAWISRSGALDIAALLSRLGR